MLSLLICSLGPRAPLQLLNNSPLLFFRVAMYPAAPLAAHFLRTTPRACLSFW